MAFGGTLTGSTTTAVKRRSPKTWCATGCRCGRSVKSSIRWYDCSSSGSSGSGNRRCGPASQAGQATRRTVAAESSSYTVSKDVEHSAPLCKRRGCGGTGWESTVRLEVRPQVRIDVEGANVLPAQPILDAECEADVARIPFALECVSEPGQLEPVAYAVRRHKLHGVPAACGPKDVGRFPAGQLERHHPVPRGVQDQPSAARLAGAHDDETDAVQVDRLGSLVSQGEAHERGTLRVLQAVLPEEVAQQQVQSLLRAVVYRRWVRIAGGSPVEGGGAVLVADPDLETRPPVPPLQVEAEDRQYHRQHGGRRVGDVAEGHASQPLQANPADREPRAGAPPRSRALLSRSLAGPPRPHERPRRGHGARLRLADAGERFPEV